MCLNEYHLFIKVGGSKPDSLGEVELSRRKFSSLVFLGEVKRNLKISGEKLDERRTSVVRNMRRNKSKHDLSQPGLRAHLSQPPVLPGQPLQPVFCQLVL